MNFINMGKCSAQQVFDDKRESYADWRVKIETGEKTIKTGEKIRKFSEKNHKMSENHQNGKMKFDLRRQKTNPDQDWFKNLINQYLLKHP